MVERAHISESLRVLDGADPANASDWHAARDAVRRMLCQLGTQGIGDALGGVIESLPSLAAEPASRRRSCISTATATACAAKSPRR